MGSFIRLVLMMSLVSLGGVVRETYAQASKTGIQCEAIKRPDLETGAIVRGLSIYHLTQTPDSRTNALKPLRRSEQKFWFGENTILRDQAGLWCKQSIQDFECRHDGAKHTTHIRGGYESTTQEWVLHSNRGQNESFQEAALPLVGSGFERCHDRIIEIISDEITARFVK